MNITHPCPFCGGQLYTHSRLSTGAWLFILLGLLACGLGVIVTWIIAECTMREAYVACDNCGEVRG